MAKPSIEHGQTRRLGDLKPHPKNSRTHPPEQIAKLVASMGEFDLTRPLFVDDKDTILAGHGAWEAAVQKWGVDHEVAVSVARNWPDAKKRAYVIADNKLGELSQWDVPMLQGELKELQTKGFKLEAVGFKPLDVEAVLQPPAPPKQSSRVGTGVLQYNLVFDNAEQQQRWFTFIRKLKAGYSENATIAGKLDAFLTEQGI